MGFKLTFYSNYLNHHQIPLCEEFHQILGDDFFFVQTEKMEQDRIAMGWEPCHEEKYLLTAYESDASYRKAMELAVDSDVVIFGDAPEEYLAARLRENKLTFRYNERFFKQGIWKILYPPIIKRYYQKHIKNRDKNLHMLCASAYTAYDCSRMGVYKDKCYKWGYFPETYRYDASELSKHKNEKCVEILWVARFIRLKRPDLMVESVKALKNMGHNFKVTMVGDGNLYEKISNKIKQDKLNDCITLTGMINPDEVREIMLRANIFVFTSNFYEGWGAVVNEAMNSGCAVVASHAVGSVPFIIRHGENGLVYKNGDKADLCNQLQRLLENPDEIESFGKEAYDSIQKLWNAKTAAERFVSLSQDIFYGKEICYYEDGPCSIAGIIKNNWIKLRD